MRPHGSYHDSTMNRIERGDAHRLVRFSRANAVARWSKLYRPNRWKRGTRMLDRIFRRDRGQGLVEYALIIALVAVVVIGILILLGPAIGSIFSNIQQNL